MDVHKEASDPRNANIVFPPWLLRMNGADPVTIRDACEVYWQTQLRFAGEASRNLDTCEDRYRAGDAKLLDAQRRYEQATVVANQAADLLQWSVNKVFAPREG